MRADFRIFAVGEVIFVKSSWFIMVSTEGQCDGSAVLVVRRFVQVAERKGVTMTETDRQIFVAGKEVGL